MPVNTSNSTPLLSVKNLTARFKNSPKPTINGISFDIFPREVLAIVGESGSGKTLTACCIAQLFSDVTISGSIIFNGSEILNVSLDRLQKIRKQDIAYIFQEPGISLNPSFTIGYQLKDAANGPDKKNRALEMLKQVGFENPKKIFHSYPHELSGGMQQRSMIATALINNPKLLIADEPTTSLDVILQQQILSLIKNLQKEHGFSVLLITHDFAILQKMADRVCVMKDGKIIETNTPNNIIKNPENPYTKLLAESILAIDHHSF